MDLPVLAPLSHTQTKQEVDGMTRELTSIQREKANIEDDKAQIMQSVQRTSRKRALLKNQRDMVMKKVVQKVQTVGKASEWLVSAAAA